MGRIEKGQVKMVKFVMTIIQVLSNRLLVYKEQTMPVLTYYQEMNKLKKLMEC